MAIHSINNFKHLTGQTEAGRRRSPFLTLSYNADQALHDEQRKDPEKPYHLKHPKNDNTKVLQRSLKTDHDIYPAAKIIVAGNFIEKGD